MTSTTFSGFAAKAASALGSWQASALAFLVVAVWIAGGFYFGFMDTTYQLAINSLTTIWTFLAVGLIQNAQNRDGAAIQAKLDELIRVTADARDALIAVESRPEVDIATLRCAPDAPP